MEPEMSDAPIMRPSQTDPSPFTFEVIEGGDLLAEKTLTELLGSTSQLIGQRIRQFLSEGAAHCRSEYLEHWDPATHPIKLGGLALSCAVIRGRDKLAKMRAKRPVRIIGHPDDPLVMHLQAAYRDYLSAEAKVQLSSRPE
jgi:hypothetical protein